MVLAGDPIAKFGGESMRRLVDAVEGAVRQGRFQKRPIGPIGAHLSLTDDRWAVAVDAAIGGAFSNFIVDNHSDLATLKAIHIPVPAFGALAGELLL